ncbi:MAG: DUF3040 domain-containing protein [Rothia sp. (in: high G+C Gram-positive bacteria)]|nr:DUF3040 domain-containing protein [Rothia sp. (in: high G+C Gram-positive bacteria)]
MALSDREQELLAQLEKQLEDDPAFTGAIPRVTGNGTVAAQSATFSPRNLALGALAAVVGLAVIIVGVSSKLILVGVLGFLITAAGVYGATLKTKSAVAAPARSAAKGSSKGSFMQSLEDKWDERQGGSRF